MATSSVLAPAVISGVEGIVSKRLRAPHPVNTKIKLKIQRTRADKPLDVAITHETIRVRSVRSRNEGDDVG